MRITTVACALFLIVGSAPAQQPQNLQQDPVFLQRALGAMQSQRNAALDGQAAAEARVGMLTEELAKASADLAKVNGELAVLRQQAGPVAKKE